MKETIQAIIEQTPGEAPRILAIFQVQHAESLSDAMGLAQKAQRLEQLGAKALLQTIRIEPTSATDPRPTETATLVTQLHFEPPADEKPETPE